MVVDDVEGISREVFDALADTRAGMVLAIWRDGSVTAEGFGFRGRRRSDGTIIEPVASFPGRASLTYFEVLQRLLAGFRRHGLLPPEPELLET